MSDAGIEIERMMRLVPMQKYGDRDDRYVGEHEAHTT